MATSVRDSRSVPEDVLYRSLFGQSLTLALQVLPRHPSTGESVGKVTNVVWYQGLVLKGTFGTISNASLAVSLWRKPLLGSNLGRGSHTQTSEPILFPKLGIHFADVPY